MSVLDFMSVDDLMAYQGHEPDEEWYSMIQYLIEEPREGGGNRFWTGTKWSESALDGMRFYTKESAEMYVKSPNGGVFASNVLVCEHVFYR